MKEFEVYNGFGDLVVSGTAKQCAEALGITSDVFRKHGYKGRYKSYRIVDVPEEGEKYKQWDHDKLAKRWDDFCEPIRKAYGIPVYRPGEGAR